MDLTLQWNALLHGRAVGEVLMHDPVLNFVRSESDESSQLGTGTNWPAQIRNLFPFRLNLVEATNGLMTFQAPAFKRTTCSRCATCTSCCGSHECATQERGCCSPKSTSTAESWETPP